MDMPKEINDIDSILTYLIGIGYDMSVAMNVLHFSLEMKKVELQERLMSPVADDEVIRRIAEYVVKLMDERNQNVNLNPGTPI